MKNSFYYLLVLLLFVSCRTVSVEQRKMVRQFAAKTESFSAYPATIWSELAAIRETRGVYYANSMTDPVSHLNELDAIMKERMNDDKIPRRVTAVFKILDGYADGLAQLSSDAPFKMRSTLYGRFGDDLEILIEDNNQVNKDILLPLGTGNLLAEILDAGSNGWLARRQFKALRKYVTAADTLVAALCISLENYLSSELLVRLIQSEDNGINESFRFYFVKRSPPTVESEKEYLILKKRVAEVNIIRLQSLRAVKNLAIAHQKLAEVLTKRRSLKESAGELNSYYKEVENLRSMVKKLNL